MPYSDYLNSWGVGGDSDSDGESHHVDHLSPSNGYFASSAASSFHHVPTIPNILIPDPTLQQQQTSESGTESKAREADEEILSSNTQRSGTYFSHYNLIGSGSTQGAGQSAQSSANLTTTPDQRQHPLASAHTYSPSSPSRTSFRTRPTGGRTPSVYSDAPPAYSPSPTSPLTARLPPIPISQPRSYNTFNAATMGAADIIENERLLSREPESLSQPEDEETGRITPTLPHWSRRVRRRLPTWLNPKLVLVGLLILLVSITLLASSFRIVKEDGNKKTIGAQPVEQGPPDSEKVPAQPDTDEPAMESPFQPTRCSGAGYHFEDQVLPLQFARNRNVTFLQDHHPHAGNTQVHVAGQVHVRRLADGGDEPRIVLEIVTNAHDLFLDVYADEESQTMKVSVPRTYDNVDRVNWPCVEMRATIWVPADAEIGELRVGTTHLDILLVDDLSLHVDGYSRITSVSGSITSAANSPPSSHLNYANDTSGFLPPDHTFVPAKNTYAFDSRVIEASSTSGPITGNWPLYDLLGLHTSSGDISVSITPQAANPNPNPNPDSDKPAILSLSSLSGTVSASEPIHARPNQQQQQQQPATPPRNYLVDVKSTSGAVRAALAFSGGATFKSASADLTLDLLPVLPASASAAGPAQLETATTSGTTAVRVLSPVWGGLGAAENSAAVRGVGGRPLDCLAAVHKATSGDIRLQYPQAWEGYLQARTMSGVLRVRGRDVKVVKPSRGWGPESRLEARKGVVPGMPGSSIWARALSGDVDAVVGDV